MEEESRSSELQFADFWAVLKRCWWLMLAALVLVGILTSVALNIRHVPTYSSTATLYVLRESTSGKDTTSADVSIGTYLVKDFNVLITSDKILDYVREVKGFMIDKPTLKRMVSVSNPDGTRILQIKINAGTPKSAQNLANAFAEATDLYFNELFSGGVTSEGVQAQKVISVWGEATYSENISNPISTLKILLVALLAAFGVYAIFFIVFIFDDKINDADDVQKYLGLSLLGEIPNRYEAQKRKDKYSYKYKYKYAYSSSSPYAYMSHSDSGKTKKGTEGKK